MKSHYHLYFNRLRGKTNDAKGGIYCQAYRGDASGVSASEIRVQLAENRPQRQVQERLREYILIVKRLHSFSAFLKTKPDDKS